MASINGIRGGGFNAVTSGLRAINMLSSPGALAQSLDPTGGLLTGGGMSVGFSFTSFNARADWQQTLATSLEAGGKLTIVAGNDLSLTGATASGRTTEVTVGGDLTVASVQDRSSSSSSSWSKGFSASVGPGGVGLGVHGSNSRSNGQWTNTLGTITSAEGTSVTVGGTTTLSGGGITSSKGETTLRTSALTATGLEDSQVSSSRSFSAGVTIGPSPSASIGISASRATKLGITSSVVGPGTIELTAPGADTGVLATLSRDPAGREVVTLDTKDGYAFNISTQDLQSLASVATSVGDFLGALTAAMPGQAAAQGPVGERAYRQLLANGATPEQASQALALPAAQDAIAREANWETIVAHYEGAVATVRPVATADDITIATVAETISSSRLTS